MSNSVMSADSGDFNAAKLQHLIDLAKKGFERQINGIVDVARAYKKAILAGPQWRKKFVSAFPFITPYIWTRYELVSEGKLIPRLAVYPYTGGHVLEKLPLREQERALSGPIEVVVKDSKGQTDILKTEFQNLTPEQRKQVVTFDHIRDVAEQKAFLESEKTNVWAKTSRFVGNEKYLIVKGKMIVPQRAEFTSSELLDIIKRLSEVK